MTVQCSAGHSEGVHRLVQGGAPGLAAQGAGHPGHPRPCADPHPLHPGVLAQPAPCLLPRLSTGEVAMPCHSCTPPWLSPLCVHVSWKPCALYVLCVSCLHPSCSVHVQSLGWNPKHADSCGIGCVQPEHAHWLVNSVCAPSV